MAKVAQVWSAGLQAAGGMRKHCPLGRLHVTPYLCSIMILQNISTAIREQNYYAVALEFVIVIAGVVIGFQVNAWNESRAEVAKTELYLERLAADLAENRERALNDLQFRSEVRNLGLRAMDFALGDREPETSWQVVYSYFNASQSGSSYPVRATYEEMLSNGDFGLIEDPVLREAMINFYTAWDTAVITDAMPAYRETVRMMIPTAMQDYIWDTCYRTDATARGQQLDACPAPPLAPQEVEAVASELIGSTVLIAELRYWLSTQRAALVIHSDNLARIERLEALVAEAREAG